MKPKRLQLAVIGPGRLGSACARALIDHEELALAGIVRRPDLAGALAADLQRYPVVGHFRDLGAVDAALVCVPAQQVAGVARELLQARIPIVECAAFEGEALAAHHRALDALCRRYRAAAIVGAGWNPGVLALIERAFETLIPRGRSTRRSHPGLALHHAAAVERLAGVSEALEGEVASPQGLQRYVYVELDRGADFSGVQSAVLSDPLHAGEATRVFELDSLSALEGAQGLVLARCESGPGSDGGHASLTLEARGDPVRFAARAMLDAALGLPGLPPGAHRHSLRC